MDDVGSVKSRTPTVLLVFVLIWDGSNTDISIFVDICEPCSRNFFTVHHQNPDSSMFKLD